MRLVVDTTACQGHGRCAANAPHLIVLNDDGYLTESVIEVPEALVSEATAAAANCPEMCISVVDD